MSDQTYEKVYFKDDYSRQFGELREQYHERTQQALKRRAVDEAPVPNATTVVWMNDTPDGGVSITTGDFVAFYNARHGYDRIGELRRTVEDSVRRTELKRAHEKKVADMKRKTSSDPARRRKAKKLISPRFSFAWGVLSLMLVLSVVMFFGTCAVLDTTIKELRALETEVAVLEAVQQDDCGDDTTNVMSASEEATLSGTDSVEVYRPTEEEGFTVAALLNALASLGKK
jgi:hypothetical protein